MKMNMKTLAATLLMATAGLAGVAQEKISTYNAATGTQTLKTNGLADDIKNTGTTAVSGWSSFNIIADKMMELDGADYITTQRVITELKSSVVSLMNTRPDWMNTEEINEDIEDVQKDYNELVMEGTAVAEKEYRNNLEELAEQFEDLREEVTETYMEYAKINRDAFEEAQEEKVSPLIRAQNADAREEYEEEIKDLKNVRDGEMKKQNNK